MKSSQGVMKSVQENQEAIPPENDNAQYGLMR